MKAAQITDLYGDPGDWISLHLAAPPSPPAADVLPPTWDEVVTGLARREDPPADLIDDARRACFPADLDAGMRSVLVRPGRDATVVTTPDPPGSDIGCFADLPYALPMLASAQMDHSHAVVDLTEDDRARVVIFEDDGTSRAVVVDDVAGRRSSQLSPSAVEALLPPECELTVIWAADESGRALAEQIDCEVAGEVRTYSTAPAPWSDGVATEEDDLADEVVRRSANLTAEATVAALERWRQACEDGRGLEGSHDVAVALEQGAVEALLLHDDPRDARQAWFRADDPHSVSLDRPDPGDGEAALVARWGDVMARSAVGAGADLRVIPLTSGRGPAGGVGAILGRPAADLGLHPGQPQI